MPRPTADVRLTRAHFQALVRYQEVLLRDRPRNEAFRRALARTMRPGASVLDVGSGTGLWAVVAARLGARRVVAVEREPMLRPLIQRLVADNGVADRVQVISRDFRRVKPRREFDVVISETVGSMAFDEDIVPIMRRSRERFLVPGGTLIPRAIVFRAAPVRLRRALPDPPSLLRDARCFREVVAQIPRPLRPEEYEVLAPAVDLHHLDLESRAARAELADAAAEWTLARADRVDGIAVWLKLQLGPRAWLETRGSRAWSPKLYPIERLKGRGGRLHFRLRSSPARERWQVSLEGAHGIEDGHYCPELAYGALLAARRRRSG